MARKRPKNADDTAAHLKPCKGTCGKTTRPSWMLKREAPDTAVRASADLCTNCYNAANPPTVLRGAPEKEPTDEEAAEQERRFDHNVTMLNKYMQRREQRLNRKVLDDYRGTWDGLRHLRHGADSGGRGLRAGAGQPRREA